MVKIFLSVVCSLCCWCSVFASGDRSFIKFTENKGQWNSNVLFRAQLDGGTLFLEKKCFVYNFYEKEKLRKNHIRSSASPLTKDELEIRSHAFRMTLKNALSPKSVLPQKRSTNYSNFFIGNNPAKWASRAYDYELVYYKNIYPGIDLEVNGKSNSLKYNFIVQPGADASKICLSYEGVKKITNENGSLRIETPLTTIVESKPYAYQEINGVQVEVPCLFEINGHEVTFSLPQSYRAELPLIIDPTLIFCSYSGSLADNFGMTATYDQQGNFYAGGTAFAQGYPTTPLAFDTSYNGVVLSGRTDVVITKYNPTGSNLIYSTYLGGDSSTEIVSSIIVNVNNELMLLGATGSADFPVTPTAFDTSFNGGDFLDYQQNGTTFTYGTDIYLAKFSADGSQLLASTFVGDTANDGVNANTGNLDFNYGDIFRGEIQTDSLGNFYVASCTRSANFPVTAGSFQNSLHGGQDGCVFKMTPGLDSMIWSSFIGGTSNDCAYSLLQDTSSNVYVTGGTTSANFPVTSGAFDTVYGLAGDGFIAKISPGGDSLLRSTFIGTNGYDQSFFVQRDTLGYIYVYGQAQGNFPVSPNVYSNPNSKQFVAQLTPELDSMPISTVFGNGDGTVNLSPTAFLVDRCGNIYCSGWGGRIDTGNESTLFNMPVTPNAIQSTTDGNNFYFIVFSPFIKLLTYASYFGGALSREHVDGGTSRFDRNGVIYQSVCAGCGGNSDLPTTPGAWSETNLSQVPAANCNNGTIKIDFNITNTAAAFTAYPKIACPNLNVLFTNYSLSAVDYAWDFGDSSPISNASNPTHAYTSPGTYVVTLTSSSPFCGTGVATDTIQVFPPPNAAFTDTGMYCSNNVIQFFNNSTDSIYYLWSFGDGDTSSAEEPSHPYSSPGSYLVSLVVIDTIIMIDTIGCSDTAQKNIIIFPDPVADFTNSSNLCELTVIFSADAISGGNYSWDFGDTTFATGQNTSHTYANSGTYNVTLFLTDGNGCRDTVAKSVSPYNFSIADFLFDIDSCSMVVTFTDQSVNAVTYSWNFGDQTAASSPNVTHIYSQPGNYPVLLLVNDATICPDTVIKNVVLDEKLFSGFFVPNIFTPNDDAFNPKFTLKGFYFCEDFLLQVFNRWGELVFESTNILDSWDGTYKGNDVPDGVYFYIVKGIKANRAGTVTVKRK